MNNVNYKDAQKTFGFSDEIGDKLFTNQSSSDSFLSGIRNQADDLIGSAIKGIGDVFKRDNNTVPTTDVKTATDPITVNATDGQSVNTLAKNTANNAEGSWLSKNKSGVALAGLQVGASAIGTMQKNKALGGAISDVNDSINTLTDTKYNIAGQFSDDTRELDTELSETMQLNALNVLSQAKKQNEPVSNLSTGRSIQIAKDNRDLINEKLDSLYASTTSKAKDMANALKTSADSSVQKISSSIEGLETQKKAMEEAQKNNKWNTVVDVASAGANLALPGVGGMVAGTALGTLKKENEYT